MQNLITSMSAFKDKYMTWLNLPVITITDIVEIIIITVLFYYVMVWIKNTRAWMLFKGLLIILIFVLFAAIFEMNTILWIAERTINVGVIALVVLFQPELRKALEQLGRKSMMTNLFTLDFGRQNEQKFSEKTINEIVKATFEMGKVKTGALMVIEDAIGLLEYERTGIRIDALLTSQLLINIFEKNTPLHDGAIIIRGDRISAATCYLPLSDNMELSKELGTRHRAAVGISEVSDSMTIIVSEETGRISVAKSGLLYTNLKQEDLRGHLKAMQIFEPEVRRFESLRRRLKNVKKTDA